MTDSDLTNSQRECIRRVTQWYYNHGPNDIVFGITGRAGTGKTSIVPFIINKLELDTEDEVIFCAFTGKAASNLCKKGFNASTIHSIFYDCQDVPKKDENGMIVRKNGRIVTTLKFIKKQFINPRVKLIILDEYSMVGNDLYEALLSFNVPIIALGDDKQLPPIFSEVAPFGRHLKFELTEIMRQNKDSGIVQLANAVLDGEQFDHYKNYNNEAWVMPKCYMDDKHLQDADIILTAKNKTRNYFNDKLRELNHYHGKLPMVGEKLICRKNAWNRVLDKVPLINGTSGIVVHPIDRGECELGKGIYRCDFKPDYTISKYDYFECLPCDFEFLNEPCGQTKDKNPWNPGVALEYAYAITTHLSQGSEYPYVIYYDEWSGDRDYMRKLRYTAITRATKKFIMYI